MRTVRTYIVTLKAVEPTYGQTVEEQQVRLDIEVSTEECEPGVAGASVKRSYDEDTGQTLELPIWLTTKLCTEAAKSVLEDGPIDTEPHQEPCCTFDPASNLGGRCPCPCHQ